MGEGRKDALQVDFDRSVNLGYEESQAPVVCWLDKGLTLRNSLLMLDKRPSEPALSLIVTVRHLCMLTGIGGV